LEAIVDRTKLTQVIALSNEFAKLAQTFSYTQVGDADSQAFAKTPLFKNIVSDFKQLTKAPVVDQAQIMLTVDFDGKNIKSITPTKKDGEHGFDFYASKADLNAISQANETLNDKHAAAVASTMKSIYSTNPEAKKVLLNEFLASGKTSPIFPMISVKNA
jgi:hypothetical protein